MSNSLGRILAVMVLALALSGCKQMESTEYGIRFWKLPYPFGGLSSTIYKPGETIIDYPVISTLYTLDTRVKDISWGAKDDDFVQTRAKDGNEVALSVTVSYRIKHDDETLARVLSDVATTGEGVRRLVVSAPRADIRTYMNELQTSEFINERSRYEAVDKVKNSLNERLGRYGIDVVRVNLDDYQFRRIAPDGSIDLSYEERLKLIQETREKIAREKARIETVRAKKEQEYNVEQAKVNQMVEEADGFRNQAKLRADAYHQAKQNEAEGVLARGQAVAEGMQKNAEALSGPGGREILKLAIAKELLINNPRFVVVDSGDGNGDLRVKKLDENALLQQLGLIESQKEEKNTSEEKE